MLRIDVHQLEEGPLSLRFTMPATVLELDEPSARAEQPVAVDLVAMRQTDDVLVTGTLKTTLTVQCGRCSDWIPWPVDLQEFAQTVEIPSNHVIDLTPLVREDILLALPVVASCLLDSSHRCPLSGKVYPPETKTEPLLGGDDLWQALNKLKLKE